MSVLRYCEWVDGYLTRKLKPEQKIKLKNRNRYDWINCAFEWGKSAPVDNSKGNGKLCNKSHGKRWLNNPNFVVVVVVAIRKVRKLILFSIDWVVFLY